MLVAFTSSKSSWNLGRETLDRARSLMVFLRASGPVDNILSYFKCVGEFWAGLLGKFFVASSRSETSFNGWLVLLEGRETSELDGDGEWSASSDDVGMSNAITDAGIDSFWSSLDVPVESVTNDNLNSKMFSVSTKNGNLSLTQCNGCTWEY